MYIHKKQTFDELHSIHSKKNQKQDKIEYMLSRICNKQTSTKRSVNVRDFYTRMGQTESILSNWSRVVYILTMPIKERLLHITTNRILQQKQHGMEKLSLRVSISLTLKALELRGISIDIINRTREKLGASTEKLFYLFSFSSTMPYVQKRRSTPILSPMHR